MSAITLFWSAREANPRLIAVVAIPGRDVANIDNSGDGQTVNRFRITNGMAADERAADLGRLSQAAAQNRGNHSWSNEISRKTNDVERGQRASAHRKDVGKRIGRGDLPVGKWVVNYRCEKINGLHEGTMPIQTINAGVIESVRVHKHFPVRRNGKLRQNLPQGLLAQLGSSPSAR